MAWLMATRWWKNFEDIYVCFDTMYERDRHTDGQTPHDDIASRGKNRTVQKFDIRSDGFSIETTTCNPPFK